jgi:uncharacterized repeat protein (TIGR03806 family)
MFGSKLAMRIAAALAVAACVPVDAPKQPTFHAEGFPERLSDWRLMAPANGVLKLSDGVTPYDLATPLFSDYALKLRTLTLPAGGAAVYDADDEFDLPVGTIISKTFYYPQKDETWTGDVVIGPEPPVVDSIMALRSVRLIETRLLVHRQEGWVAIPYVWTEDQSDAVLRRTGEVKKLTLHRPDGREEPFAYLVPNQNQCAGCHATNNTTRKLSPIGIKARHLNKPSSFAPGSNQLDHWVMTGMLVLRDAALRAAPQDEGAARRNLHPEEPSQGEGVTKVGDVVFPRNAVWTDESESLDARARAYLDANCSHCHSDVGPADTSGLDLRPHIPFGPKFGACKSPIASGGGSGGRLYDIVPGEPDQSIFVYRMQTTKPGAMMPELGRATSHEEGVALIAEWIAAIDGGCG